MGVLPAYMCCLCLPAQCPQKWEDSGSPGIGVVGGCEPP